MSFYLLLLLRRFSLLQWIILARCNFGIWSVVANRLVKLLLTHHTLAGRSPCFLLRLGFL
jgi:hypothetical protein